MARGEVLPVADDADDHQQQRGCDVRDHRGEADLPPGSVGEQNGTTARHATSDVAYVITRDTMGCTPGTIDFCAMWYSVVASAVRAMGR
ncbi:MAG: hypothetical protein DMD42_02185 [Gemmatimonadetes bacterium]|nr:MAG: hypothetical protein DMD42_02185 [Gemmatimonadota bacterium]